MFYNHFSAFSIQAWQHPICLFSVSSFICMVRSH